MTDLSYLELGKKMMKPSNVMKVIRPSLLSGNKPPNNSVTTKEIIEGYCDELMKLLSEEDLKTMISGIFQIQNRLSELVEEKNSEMLPSLEDFFRQLSPLILEVLWENLSQGADQGILLKKCQEAIRISLEEELYLWQDRN